jgi:hypothetical protein
MLIHVKYGRIQFKNIRNIFTQVSYISNLITFQYYMPLIKYKYKNYFFVTSMFWIYLVSEMDFFVFFDSDDHVL